MKHKHQKDRDDWYRLATRNDTRPATIILQKVIAAIDALLVAVGQPEIMITSFLRPTDKDSYHWKAQAADIRTHGRSGTWCVFVTSVLWLCGHIIPNLQIDMHRRAWGTANEHFHVEYDDNSLNKE